MSREEDEESGGQSEARSRHKKKKTWWLLVIGFFVACCLVIALLSGFMVGIKSTRRSDTHREKKTCNKVRDSITNWAFFLSGRAFSIGSSCTTHTTQTQLPFLMPNKDVYDSIAAGVRHIDTMRSYGGTTQRDFYGNPSIFWHPAVLHADRELYESFMSSVVGFNVSIQDGVYTGDQAFGWSEGKQSPARPVYFPLSSVWGPLSDPVALSLMIKVVGDDVYSVDKQIPPAVRSRLFDERRPTTHVAYDPYGKPIVNNGLIFTVPYCGFQGCDDANATILGLISQVIVADDWGTLFPDRVEVMTFGKGKVKSVDASRYSAHVEAHESYMDLEIRCYYEPTSVFHSGVLPYLWIGAIALLVSIVVLVAMYSLDNAAMHSLDRSAWALTQHRILNAMPDAIVSTTFTKDAEPTMVCLNQACDHGFHGMASTIALSDIVPIDDLARVRALFKDPSTRAIDFESRFVGSACAINGIITYEVAVSQLVSSGKRSHERVCVFRDVSARVLREEESRQAALLLTRAEESLAAKALKSAEERLSDNVKTDTYLSHELKNRIIVLLDSICCARSDFDVPPALRARLDDITGIAEELLAMTKLKSVLLHLATGVYSARLEDTDLPKLLETRLARYLGGGLNLTSAPTVGAAASSATTLLLDPMLFNIICDNLLSNALKYGDAEQPPSVALRIEPVEDGVVSVSFTVRNAAGSGHAHLLEIGETELNRIAAKEGARAHGQLGAPTSSGDGFPMAAASAKALGGTLRLGLSESTVEATLTLPRVKLETAAAHFGAMEILELSMALVDDSMPARKMMKRKIERAFVSCMVPVVAGETHGSIESFPKAVVSADSDVLFVDQNFGDIHQTKVGTDLVRAIRALDLAADNSPRLIFLVSANDAPNDILAYCAAGADGHIAKTSSYEEIRMQVLRLASNSNRFRGRVTRSISK